MMSQGRIVRTTKASHASIELRIKLTFQDPTRRHASIIGPQIKLSFQDPTRRTPWWSEQTPTHQRIGAAVLVMWE
eukprot:COSAG01_NODE_484_length_16405_cov_4.252790_5_plen_75_part_00